MWLKKNMCFGPLWNETQKLKQLNLSSYVSLPARCWYLKFVISGAVLIFDIDHIQSIKTNVSTVQNLALEYAGKGSSARVEFSV